MTNQNRYEVTAPMPHFTHLMAGDILVPKHHALCGDCWGKEDEEDVSKWVTFCPDYPHLFRSLEWWQLFPINELPKYIKDCKVGKHVIRVDRWVVRYGDNAFISEANKLIDYAMIPNYFIPATEEEYNTYINNKKNQNEQQ